MTNPILEAWKTRRRNRRAAEGWVGTLLELLGPVAATLLLVPLLQPVFLGWLKADPSDWGAGMSAVVLRMSLLVIGVLSLDLYSALIRGSDRPVLAVLPVNPEDVVRTELWAVMSGRWWMVPAAAVLLAPVAAAGAWELYAVGLVVVALSFLLGLVLSAWVHLRAVDAAEDPSWAGWLDRVRGSNPREQAAFLYAPGVIIMAGGALMQVCCWAVEATGAGDLAGLIWLAAPVPLVGYAWRSLPVRSTSWFAGGLVLAEIDARYAAFEDPEEGRRVYLDWMVRWFPAVMAPYALKDLRHGWRARRTWITGAWLLAVGAFAAGWTGSELGPVRAADVALASSWLCATIGVLMAADEPEFLRAWLPAQWAARRVSRALVLVAWLQPPAWLGAASVFVRRGLGDAGMVLVVGQGSAVAAALVAILCGGLGRRGLAVYAPVGAVVAGLSAFLLGA